MTASLTRAELRSVADVAELTTAEGAELFSELRSASVPLGDRARLRKAAGRHGRSKPEPDVQPGYVEHILYTGADGTASPLAVERPSKNIRPGLMGGQTHPGPSQPGAGWSTSHRHNPSTSHRQLQSGGGFSIEMAAIVATGLIGMVGYAVQARSAQKASQAQASLGREVA